MLTKYILGVTYFLSGTWWICNTINAAEILKGPSTFVSKNKSDDVDMKCQNGKLILFVW